MADEHTPDEPASEPASEGHSHDHSAAPGLPEIHDEAGDTPSWVHWVGIGLLVALLAVLGARAFLGEEDGADGTGDAAAVVEAESDE